MAIIFPSPSKDGEVEKGEVEEGEDKDGEGAPKDWAAILDGASQEGGPVADQFT